MALAIRQSGSMTEIVTNPDAGNTRRLPAWMLQVNAADRVEKSADGGTKCSLSEEKENTRQAAKSKTKPVINDHLKILPEEVGIINQAESLPGRVRERRIKKATRSEDAPSTSFATCAEAQRKLKRKNVGDGPSENERTTSRKRKLKSKRPKNPDVEEVSSERSDEEISLTVEDLLSIAKEYVSADKETKCKQHATSECKSETNPSGMSNSFNATMGGAIQACGSNQILSKCTSSNCSSRLNENENESKNHKSENLATNITGDAAQDMLNLYLGPFLKKSSPKDQTTELRGLPSIPSVPSVQTVESKGLPAVRIMESKGLSSAQSIDHGSKDLLSIKAFEAKYLPSIQATESGLPSIYKSNEQPEIGALMKEVAPLTKKKSSFKDKASMFFN